MLNIHRQNGMKNQKKKTEEARYARASALLLAAVTALSPLSVHGAVPGSFLKAADTPAAMAAAADPSEAVTAEEAVSSSTSAEAEKAAGTEEPGESASADSPASLGNREIYVHLAEAPGDPVPAKVMDTDTASLLKLISEGLVVLDENNRPAPGCAESWEASKDGLQWTFHLRDGLKWSDGAAMKASDFVSLFKNTADTSTEALYGSQLTRNIAGYEDVLKGDASALQVHAPDDRTLVVDLVSPDPEFPRACASWALLPIRELVRKDPGDKVSSDWDSTTGNGLYYVDSAAYGKEIILKKNPWYSKAGTEENTSGDKQGTAFDTVHWIVDGEINEDYSDYLNGDLDAISAIPEEEERLLESENLIHRKNLPDTMGICFNCRHQVLGDARVRRALSLAVDRAFIASTILEDVYQPEGGDGLSSQGDVEDHIPQAKKLLEEAGYEDGEGIPTLTCIADKNGSALLTAEYLASAWKDLGIDVHVEAEKAKDLAQEKAAGTFDIFCGSIYLASDLPAAELAAFTTENENNISGFSLQEYDQLIEKASKLSDEKEYAGAIEQAAAILREEVPVAPLVTRCISWLRRDEYPGISCDSTGCWQLQDIEPDPADNAADTGTFVSRLQDKAAEEKAESSRTGSGMKAVTVTAQMPAGKSAAGQAANQLTLPQIGSAGTSRQAVQSAAETGTGPDFIRTSDLYFQRTSQQAYLTRQAWTYDGTGENAQPRISLPKYAEVHLTGTGNPRFVRIWRDGKTWYLDSNRVSADAGLIDKLRTKEREELAERAVLTASLHSVKESELEDRAADARARTEEIKEAIARREMLRTQTRNPNWNGPVLSRGRGSVMGPSGKETYYNLNMNGVVNIMRRMGNTDEYWVRDDGCKMLGDYIMCAANLRVHPRGSLVESSLGTCIVCDTGGFASHNANQLDIAVTW